MHTVIGTAGALLGGGLGVLARRRGPHRERRILAVALVVAALVYVVFAAARGAAAQWLVVEAGGVPLFAAFAWAGLRRSPLWLAAGWALHVAWDVGLHSAVATPFVPSWYPPLCVGFDLIVALWIAIRWRELTGLPTATAVTGPS